MNAVAGYNIPQAQKDLFDAYTAKRQQGITMDESQVAVLYAKILIQQTNRNISSFCADNELYIAKNPSGYAITGYYLDGSGKRVPFQLTVCNQNGAWYPAKNYVAADTKSGSNFILLWLLLMLGCTAFGIIMYFIISAAVGL